LSFFSGIRDGKESSEPAAREWVSDCSSSSSSASCGGGWSRAVKLGLLLSELDSFGLGLGGWLLMLLVVVPLVLAGQGQVGAHGRIRGLPGGVVKGVVAWVFIEIGVWMVEA
jgi:hypothetical protein